MGWASSTKGRNEKLYIILVDIFMERGYLWDQGVS